MPNASHFPVMSGYLRASARPIHFAVLLCYNTCMGGYGSGRSYGRPVAEDCLRIDLAWLIRKGFAVPGHWRSGQLRWSSNGQPSGDINYSCDMRDPEAGELELRFTTGASRGEPKKHVQRISLSYTVPKLGGRRWWMHCPVKGERVGKLYVPPGGDIFASRKAWKIGYRSQRNSPRDRPFEALFKLQRRLGCTEGWEQMIRRPKGMHHRTYARLEDEYWRLDRQCNYAMAPVVAQLMQRCR